jgi:hypothetical protein
MTEPKPLLGEIWLLERISEYCHQVKHAFAGVTDQARRKQLLRQAIDVHGLDCTICGRDPTTKQPQTFAEAFKRLYGE